MWRSVCIVSLTLLTSAIAWAGSQPRQFNEDPLGFGVMIVACALGALPLTLGSLWTKPLMRGAAIAFGPTITTAAALTLTQNAHGALPILAVIAAFSCLAANVFLPDRGFEHGPTKCRECGYDLRGNVSGACPECNADIVTMKWLRFTSRKLNVAERIFAWFILSLVSFALTVILLAGAAEITGNGLLR